MLGPSLPKVCCVMCVLTSMTLGICSHGGDFFYICLIYLEKSEEQCV